MKKHVLSLVWLLAVCALCAQNPMHSVQLKNGQLNTDDNLSEVLQQNTAYWNSLRFQNNFYFIVRFLQLPNQALSGRLQANGIALHDYLGSKTFTASADVNIFHKDSLHALGIVHLSAMPGNLKTDNRMYAGNTPDYALTPDGKIEAAVLFYPGNDRDEVITALEKTGAVLSPNDKPNKYFVLMICDAIQVELIASMSFVKYVEPVIAPLDIANYENRVTHHLPPLNASFTGARNLQGQGMCVGVGDGGFVTHIDFEGRLTNGTSLSIGSFGNHEDHVTGTVGGNGNKTVKNTGMAPKARLITLMTTDIIDNAELFHNVYGMELTNNSYGPGVTLCSQYGIYDYSSLAMDDNMMANTKVLHCFAAGNSGAATCSPFPIQYGTVLPSYQPAKNIMTVGAVDYLDAIASFSSCGPLVDGRIKPDICGVGVNVVSTMPTNTYANNNGTSMATPTVTGTMALLTQRYKQLHSGSEPDMALMKSIAMCSADDLGNTGPDFKFGFGRINGTRAVKLLEAGTYLHDSLINADTNLHSIVVPANTYRLNVFITWREEGASPLLSKALINDLDLQVKDSAGPGTTQAWVLNHVGTGVSSAAHKGRDSLNNNELVTIDTPAASTYYARVIGHEIPVGFQDYYLSYQIVPKYVELIYPFGGETFVPGEVETIRWDAFGYDGNTFTLEYSTDSGTTWTTISSSIAATARTYAWTVPSVTTGRALMRVTRNSSGLSSASQMRFTIMGVPGSLAVNNFCTGNLEVSWAAVTGATMYEVLRVDTFQKTYSYTTNTKDTLEGQLPSTTVWVSVRAINADGTAGRYQTALSSGMASATNCNWTNDVGIKAITVPVSTGRENSSTALSATQSITVTIKNYGNNSVTNIPVNYTVNGGTPVSETYTGTITAGSTFSYTFTTTANLSAVGSYSLNAYTSLAADMRAANNDIDSAIVIRQLSNAPITLPYLESFESTPSVMYNNSITGIDGNDHVDFTRSNGNGRLSMRNDADFASNGTRAATAHTYGNGSTSSKNDFIYTINLSAYTAALVYMDFSFMHHGETANNHDTLFVRGNDAAAWVVLYDLFTNRGTAGIYNNVNALNITGTLSTAGQVVSSSTQLKFGSQSNLHAIDPSFYGGYTFDEIRLYDASNDVTLSQIVAPVSACGLGASEVVTVKVSNNGTAAATNVNVYYQADGGSIISETIASIPASSFVNHSFSTNANFSSAGLHTLSVWCNYSGDNYFYNDSVMGTSVRNIPLVTSFPYLEGFESTDGGWFTDGVHSSWQWGTPAKLNINDAPNGNKIWTTDLDIGYVDNETSYLNSPCYNLSSFATNPVLSFSHQWMLEAAYDFTRVEYSENNGTSWTTLGVMGSGTNWYDVISNQWNINHLRWSVSSYDIPVLSMTDKTKVRFRYRLASDVSVNYEGIGVDDVNIYPKSSIYSGTNIHNMTLPVSGSNWVSFTSGGNTILQINPNGNNLGNTTVSEYRWTGAIRNNAQQYYLNRNWVINPATQPSTPVDVRLFFTETEAEALRNASGCGVCTSINDAYKAGVTKYDGPLWTEDSTLTNNYGSSFYAFLPPGVVQIIPYDNGYYAEFSVNSFSEFWINGGGPGQNTPLPVTLLNFTAEKTGSNALLNWQTASEQNALAFDIEVAEGNDALARDEFAKIGEVAAAGNSTDIRHYTFTDARSNKQGIYYYRLKQRDINGDYVYTDIRALSFGNELPLYINAHPVPFTDYFTLSFYSAHASTVSWAMYDVNGVLVQTVQIQTNEGMNYFDWNTSKLSSGVYLLRNETGAILRVVK